MLNAGKLLITCFIFQFTLLSACTTGAVRDDGGAPTAQIRAIPENGTKIRIVVGRFIKNTGPEDQIIRDMFADAPRELTRAEQIEYQKKLDEYTAEFLDYMTRVHEVGYDKAGPAPIEPQRPMGRIYTDPIAGALQDMMTNALFNSGRFRVLERQGLEQINWEQAYSQNAAVGGETSIPAGQIEGAELILMGSLNTLEETSGGTAGTFASDILHTTAGFFGHGVPMLEESVGAGAEWETVKAAMEIRLIDARTARVVAVATVEGEATDVGGSYSRVDYTFNAGPLPQTISIYSNTPVEDAFRKMIDAVVEYILTKTPDSYYHH
jgi:curli biogenesis system outer membrane secretion channel CsgG